MIKIKLYDNYFRNTSTQTVDSIGGNNEFYSTSCFLTVHLTGMKII